MHKFQVMKSTQLLLTRHGETEENRRHVLQGQLPGTLSDLGWQQAELLADRLKNQPLDVIVCSDLARSLHTAETVAKRREMQPVVTPLLREMDWGIYTGETLEEVDWYHLPQGVESVEDLYLRAGEFIGFLKVEFSGKKILAVGHGAFNRAIQTYLQAGKPYDMVEMPIMGNTEITRWEI